MGHAGHTKKWRHGVCALLLALLLSHCGGADIPYLATGPSGSNPGSGVLQNPNNTSNLQGCGISFNSDLVLETKGGGDLGEIKSDPRKVNPIPLRFGASQVALYAQEFPTIDLVIEGAPAAMRIQQKEASMAEGSYDSDSGNIEIRNVVFIVTLLDKNSLSPMGLAPIEMPPLTLTTGSITQSGKFGDIAKQGMSLDNSTKQITLVGGLAIPNSFPSDDLKGASLVVSFAGALADLPSAGNCSGSFTASGVIFKSVVAGEKGEVENEVANNVLSFDRVYVPQAGVDVVAPGDSRFISKRKLRVKNSSDSNIEANLQNSENFKISPQGNVQIPVGASKDFQIEFLAPPQSNYSEQSVPSSKEVSVSLSFGSTSLKLAGEARRAASELVITGTESHASSTVDLGLVPAMVLGSGANAKLDCRNIPGKKVPMVSRQVSLENHGIRPLKILKINPPQDTQVQVKDPLCSGYPNEFVRIALAQEGSTQCKTLQQNGKTYITDDCSLPDSHGKLSFKIVYWPVNASSVVHAINGKPSPDTGMLAIASDDPRFDKSKGKEDFKLNLSAGVSPDQSDVLRIQKEGSKTQVTQGGNIRINIPNSSDASMSQKLFLLNHLDQELEAIKISVEDSTHFEISQNPPVPQKVPAMGNVGGEAGRAEFTVKFIKTPGMNEGDVATRLKVKFTPKGGSENILEVNLIGSVNHKILTGDVSMQIDFISSYFDSSLLQSGPIDSEDFRSGRFDAFRPGNMEMVFSEVPGQENIRHVTMRYKLNVDPYNPNLLETILNLPPSDRKKLLRVYSTRLSGYPGGVEDGNNDGIPDCVEPMSLKDPFLPSHCSFFYYVFGTKPGKDGIYDDETGELFFPDVKLRLLNPYHASVLDYNSTTPTNTELKASIATSVFDSLSAGNGLPLVADPRITSANIAIPDALAKNLFASSSNQCPANWTPWDASKKPALGCFVRTTSPHYLRGFPARPLGNDQYSIVISMMSQLNPAVGAPEHVPSFMANSHIWVAILGRLKPGISP